MLCDYCKYLETKMTHYKGVMIYCRKRPCEIVSNLTVSNFDPNFNCNIFRPLSKKKALIKKAVLEFVNKEKNNE